MLQKLFQVMISCSSISIEKGEAPMKCVAVFYAELQAHLLGFGYFERNTYFVISIKENVLI